MTWPPAHVPLDQLPHADYRSAIRPSEILPERRRSPQVGAMSTARGARRRRYVDLTPQQQRLFDAQLAAWRAAVDLVRETDAMLMIGQYDPVGSNGTHALALGELAEKWEEARFALMNERLRRAL